MQSTCSSWTTVAIDILVADVCTMLFFEKCNWPNYAKLKQEFSCGKRMTIMNKYSRLTRYIFLLVSISFFSDFKPLRSPSKLCLEFFLIIRNTHAGFASDTCNTCYLSTNYSNPQLQSASLMYARYFFKASSFKIFWKPTFPFSLQITCSGRLINKMKRSNKRHDSSKGLKKRARSGSERVKIVFITRLVPNLPRFFHSSVTIALSITALCITRTERLEKTRLKRNVGQINILRKKSNHIALIIDSMQYYRNIERHQT